MSCGFQTTEPWQTLLNFWLSWLKIANDSYARNNQYLAYRSNNRKHIIMKHPSDVKLILNHSGWRKRPLIHWHGKLLLMYSYVTAKYPVSLSSISFFSSLSVFVYFCLLTLHTNVGTKSLPYMLLIKEKGFFKVFLLCCIYVHGDIENII